MQDSGKLVDDMEVHAAEGTTVVLRYLQKRLVLQLFTGTLDLPNEFAKTRQFLCASYLRSLE